MHKLDQNTRNKLNSLWFIIAIMCVVITYCYMKVKATDNYKAILQVASQNCNLEVVKFSVKNLLDVNTQIPRVTALHYASGSGCLEVTKFLLEKGADTSAAGGYERWTALHYAADEGHLEVVKLLLNKGADPNATAKDGRTPRSMAVIESQYNKNNSKPYREVIKLLSDAEDTAQGKQ